MTTVDVHNDHCGWERIVRKLPLYGPLHRLKNETRALMYNSLARVIFCVTP